MGFACPVCETPHQDATHLANHVAFTAMTHGNEHEAWLDDHVPEWSGYGEADLAAEVAELAPEAEYDQVFEDTVGTRGGADARFHDHGTARDGAPEGIDPESAAAAGGGELDETARAVLEEARGLTAELFEGANEEDPASGGDDPDASAGGDGSDPDSRGDRD